MSNNQKDNENKTESEANLPYQALPEKIIEAIKEDLKEEKQTEAKDKISRVLNISYRFTGPLPHPNFLKGYAVIT